MWLDSILTIPETFKNSLLTAITCHFLPEPVLLAASPIKQKARLRKARPLLIVPFKTKT
jgi:hypothetical protein